jgi:hypothetical protein
LAASHPDPARRPPVVLAVLPQLIPSTVIGVVKPLLALHREGRITFDVALESWVSRHRLERADVVVFSRNTEPHYGVPLEAALAFGKPIVYELDDDFFAIPPGTPGSDYHRDPARLGQLERYLRSASLVRVYSEALRARVAVLNPHVHRVDALVDWALVPAAPPRRDPARLRIVYATSRTADRIAAMFVADLRRVLDTFAGRVEAWFWGYRPAELAGRPDVHFREFVQDYDTFFRRFAAAGFDIGIAPLPDDEFHRAKSDNKFREYAASRIAGIYSDVQVYRECVAPGRTGVLAPAVPGAWFDAMARLIEDGALRTGIQDGAWAYARTRYGVAQAQQAWLTHIEAALDGPRAEPGALPASPVGVPLDLRARAAGVIRRGTEVLRGGAAPGVLALGARLRWHIRSARGLARVRRELARSSARAPRTAWAAAREP